MRSFSCHTGPVINPSYLVLLDCSNNFSSFLNHINAKELIGSLGDEFVNMVADKTYRHVWSEPQSNAAAR